MASKNTGAETDTTSAATASAEPGDVGTDTANQNDNVTNQLTELEGKLSELQAMQTKLEQERNDAVAARLREEAKYKGLQNQTTKTLQQAAEDRRALEQASKDRAELSEIKSLLETLANRVLDEDEKKDLQFRQRELKLKLQEQAQTDAFQRAQAEAAQAVASPQYQNPEDEKAQFLNYYFPDSGVDSNDPNIDWGDGASSTQEAFRRFTVSVLNIKNKVESARTQNAMAEIQKQTEKALADFKEQQAGLIETAKTEAINTARKDSEKKLRSLGAGVQGTPATDGSQRTLAQQMEVELDDNLLRTKEGSKEYNRRIEAIKNQVRGR